MIEGLVIIGSTIVSLIIVAIVIYPFYYLYSEAKKGEEKNRAARWAIMSMIDRAEAEVYDKQLNNIKSHEK